MDQKSVSGPRGGTRFQVDHSNIILREWQRMFYIVESSLRQTQATKIL